MSDPADTPVTEPYTWNRSERDGKRLVCRQAHDHLSGECVWEAPPATPPISGDDLGEALDEFQIAFEERHAAGSERSARRCIAARKAIESLVAALRKENERLEKLLAFRQVDVSEIQKMDAELSRLRAENERQNRENVDLWGKIGWLDAELAALRSARLSKEERMAIEGAADLVDFAYEHGFHEEGFNRPAILRALARRLSQDSTQ